MSIQIKRIYEEATKADGYRVLVDRLWPRGISKDKAKLDLWLKDIAPSPELRIWFGHDAIRFVEFKSRYETELQKNPATTQLQKLLEEQPVVTLLYGAKNPEVNHARVLLDFLKR